MSLLCWKLYNALHWTQNTIKIYLIGLQGLVYMPPGACKYQPPYYLTGLNSNYSPSCSLNSSHSSLGIFKNARWAALVNLHSVPSTQNALLPDICIFHLLQAFVQMSSHLFCSLATYAFCITVIACSILFFYRTSILIYSILNSLLILYYIPLTRIQVHGSKDLTCFN